MKNILLLKKLFVKGFVILFIFITLVNCAFLIFHVTDYLTNDENNYPELNNQALIPSEETSGIKVHFKLLFESFPAKFCSYDQLIKKLDNHHKILTIISETISETNQRNSSFLITELTTST